MTASPEMIDQALEQAWVAFHIYRNLSLKSRADFLRSIALEIEALGDELIHTTMAETNLPEARLRGERGRTIFQLNSYAEACEEGSWMEVRIDTAIPAKVPPKPDIRKMQVAIGPVVVFGASNFPYAFSTAGGDTASALAVGCPVVVKAHPAHPKTSQMIAGAILKAAKDNNMPEGVFAHIEGASFETGKALVMHARTKAVGFTGSFSGGMALYNWANERRIPIPVFAEMSSINPVYLLPGKLAAEAATVATAIAGSVTLGVGQFCTNPGLIIGIDGEDLDVFTSALGAAIKGIKPAKMLHPGIAKAYVEKKELALGQDSLVTVALSETAAADEEGSAAIASVTGEIFLGNPLLHQEVFGPYSLIVRCKNSDEMMAVTQKLEGQLTATLMATDNDITDHAELVEAVKDICGRIIINNVPTGVEVCLAMHHGGPYPATTFSQFTSVGADSFKRFIRPISFQNWPEHLLPEALQINNA